MKNHIFPNSKADFKGIDKKNTIFMLLPVGDDTNLGISN